MGGASGVIFGSLFSAGAKKLGKSGAIGPEDFALMMKHSLDEIKARGGAQLGDKTMVDALEPAVYALQNNSACGFAKMTELAAEAAIKGAEDTRGYIAKYGRAKSLGERAIGHVDAGAVSTSIIFSVIADYFKS